MTTMTMLEDIVAQIAVGQQELRKELQEAHKKLAEETAAMAVAQKETQRTVERVTASVDRVNKNMGGLSNSIGEIVEMIVIPGLRGKMDAFNHKFTIASSRREYADVDGRTLTEVDLLLENCEEVMVVEVKTQFSQKWLSKFLKKLEILRKKESITGMTGKTMYAAIVGINFDAEARALAVENGMYIIEIEEEQERVKVIPPEGKAGTW